MRVEFNCPECMCAFSACECPSDWMRVLAGLGLIAVVVGLILS